MSLDLNKVFSGSRFDKVEQAGFFGQTWTAWALFFALALTVLIFTASVDAWVRKET